MARSGNAALEGIIMRRSMIAAALLLLAFAPGVASRPGFAVPQEKPEAKETEDKEFQKRVEAAIDKGVTCLLEKLKPGSGDQQRAELICLALVHSGLRRDHPFLVEQINKVLDRPLS